MEVKECTARTFSLTMTEEPGRIVIALTATRYGHLGDEAELSAWMQRALSCYDSDPRPIVMLNQHSGETAIIGDSIAVIKGPTCS